MTVEDVIGYLNGRIKITHKGAIVLDFEWDEFDEPFFRVGNLEIFDQLTMYQRVYVSQIHAERKGVFVVEIEFDSDIEE